MADLEERVEELGLDPKEKRELLWWINEGELDKVYNYLENWKFITDISEKFDEYHVCCICGNKSDHTVNGKWYCSKHRGHMKAFNRIKPITQNTPNEIKMYDGYCSILTRDKSGEKVTDEFFISDESVSKVIDYVWKKSNEYCGCTSASIRLHRLVFDSLDSPLYVDHINRDTYNNRLSNLREANDEQNSINAKISTRSVTGAMGVRPFRKSGKYRVTITIKGKCKVLGYFEDLEEAIKIRLEAEVKYFKEFAPQLHLCEKYGVDFSHLDFQQYEDQETKRMHLIKALE